MPRAAKIKSNRGKAAPAGKARKKRNWRRTVLFYLLFPLVVWLIAFLVWFYWYDLTRNLSKSGEKPKNIFKRESKFEAREKVDPKKPEQLHEKILDEDRQKLEDILKRRK